MAWTMVSVLEPRALSGSDNLGRCVRIQGFPVQGLEEFDEIVFTITGGQGITSGFQQCEVWYWSSSSRINAVIFGFRSGMSATMIFQTIE